MAITVLTDGSTANNSRTLSFTIPTLAVGDVVVFVGETWDQTPTIATPTGSGLSFGTARAVVNTSGKPFVSLWACKATSGGTNVVVTATTSGSSIHNGVLWVYPAADGWDLATTPNVLSTNGLTSSGSLAGTSGNGAVVGVADWNGTNGSTRSWLLSATEDLYQFSSGDTTQYFGHCTLTGSSNTVGISGVTSGNSWAVVAIEILKSAGGTPGTFTASAGDASADGGSAAFTGAATFTANAGDAPAAGGSASLTVAATFAATAGDAPADGGSASFTGAAVFSVSAGDGPADGGSASFTGAAVFSATAGDAAADGGSASFTAGSPATFTANAGDAPADGGTATFTGAALFSASAGDASADGGSASFTVGGTGTFTALAGDAAADGGTASFTAGAVFTATAGDASADGGSASFTATAVFTALAGDAPAAGGTASMVGGTASSFVALAGDAAADGGTATFTGAAVFTATAGGATAAGGSASFTVVIETTVSGRIISARVRILTATGAPRVDTASATPRVTESTGALR